MIQNTRVKYYVSMPEPHTHYFQVKMVIPESPTSPTDFHLAVWTPGSYLIREYSRNIIDFQAFDGMTNTEIESYKIAKNIWRVDNKINDSIYVTYRVYSNELTVRTSHLDSSHGYFNGTTLFFYTNETKLEPISLEITPFKDWKISTGLLRSEKFKNIFYANDWEELVDCPVEIGTHTVFNFVYRKKNHEVAIYGEGNYNIEKLKKDIPEIVSTVCEIWNDVPYETYTFIIHLSDNIFGGLEHRNSNTSISDRFSFSGKKYDRFLSLLTHEFFHLFLVKRIKPESFFSYDYENETYTSHLWIMEGVTSYYDQYLLLRSKLVTPDIIFGMFAENIKQLEQIPGRFVQSIEESSFDAWVKFYRSDENTSNTTISYYLKGSLVTFSLDIFIRIKSGNLYTFEDVLRYLYTTYAKNSKGYPEKGDNFIDIIKTVTQVDVRTFYDDYIVGRKDPEFVEILNHLGLDLKREYDKKFGFDEKSVGYLGIETEIKENRLFIKKILADSPAYNFGLNFNDEIIAINDYRVLSDNFEERIANFKPETIIKFLISRKGQMKNINVTLGMSKASKYTITFVKNPTDTQKAFYKSWSSQEFPNSEKINS